MNKKYEAMVLSCMDPRFQKPVHKYLDKKKLTKKFSAFTIAGGSIGVTNEKFKKWHSTFWENLETSINLHRITKLIIIKNKIKKDICPLNFGLILVLFSLNFLK